MFLRKTNNIWLHSEKVVQFCIKTYQERGFENNEPKRNILLSLSLLFLSPALWDKSYWNCTSIKPFFLKKISFFLSLFLRIVKVYCINYSVNRHLRKKYFLLHSIIPCCKFLLTVTKYFCRLFYAFISNFCLDKLSTFD